MLGHRWNLRSIHDQVASDVMTEPCLSETVVSAMDRTRPVVKICGLTRAEDVLRARDLGVWALGFVFAPSPRRTSPETARKLVESVGLGWAKDKVNASTGGSKSPEVLHLREHRPLTVGVFTESTAQEIGAIVRRVGLDGVQLHGARGASAGEVRTALADRGAPVLIIQVVPVDSDTGDQSGLRTAVQKACREADVVLLDTRIPLQSQGEEAGRQPSPAREAVRFGGTGRAFPWHLASELGTATPLLVAGGIGPHNARAALTESGAWGVDVSSGVESAPGVKSARLMEELVASIREGIGI